MYATSVSSHAELWRRLPTAVREAKSAARGAMGDLYEPVGALTGDDAFAPDRYRRPIAGHVHREKDEWRRDIEQTYRRHPCLLVGEPRLSFIWTTPRLWLMESSPLARNPTSSPTISGFLSRLREEVASA